MAVITISRQYGSGGDEIAQTICQMMDLHLFDKKMIARAAFEADLSDQEIFDYSEENYRVKNFLDRLLGRSRTIAQMRVWHESINGSLTNEEIALSEDTALALEKKAILSAHKSGNMVILGRGGQILLKEFPDVFHVRIEAPLEDRILRVRNMQKPGYNQANEGIDVRRQAQDIIQKHDEASQAYLKQLYGIDWSDPIHYHMILNTGRLSIVAAATIIVKAVRQMQSEPVSTE